MRKVVESTFVTLDGVHSSPERWSTPYWDEEYSQYSSDLLMAADSLLLGRETYETFAKVWPAMREAEGAYAERMNSLPKHVASRTLTEAAWNATVIKGDVATEVAKLKEQSGGSILKFGTGELDRTLLENRLVDEYHFWMFPAFVGSGERLFDGFDPTHLRLLRCTPFKSGITVLTYAPK
ncbi:dihydrofolate reductase family protein [Streptomyces sp. O3]